VFHTLPASRQIPAYKPESETPTTNYKVTCQASMVKAPEPSIEVPGLFQRKEREGERERETSERV
jgi:hypothetical protein